MWKAPPSLNVKGRASVKWALLHIWAVERPPKPGGNATTESEGAALIDTIERPRCQSESPTNPELRAECLGRVLPRRRAIWVGGVEDCVDHGLPQANHNDFVPRQRCINKQYKPQRVARYSFPRGPAGRLRCDGSMGLDR